MAAIVRFQRGNLVHVIARRRRVPRQRVCLFGSSDSSENREFIFGEGKKTHPYWKAE